MEEWAVNALMRMRKNKITQAQVANKLGLTRQWLCTIFNGRATPKHAEERINRAIDELIEEAG